MSEPTFDELHQNVHDLTSRRLAIVEERLNLIAEQSSKTMRTLLQLLERLAELEKSPKP